MRVLGREIEASRIWEKVKTRLEERGLAVPDDTPPEVPEVEPRVDPVRHHLEGLERYGDPTQGLPLHTHRTGLGRAVLLAKWLFRKTCQPLINEALGNQRRFNAHARDAYAELAARVERLSTELEALQTKRATTPRKRTAKRSNDPARND